MLSHGPCQLWLAKLGRATRRWREVLILDLQFLAAWEWKQVFSGRPRAAELAESSLQVDFPSLFHSLLYMGCNCHRSTPSWPAPSSESYIRNLHSRTQCFVFAIGRRCPVPDPLWSSHSLLAVWSPPSTPSCRSWLHQPHPLRQTRWP